MCAVRRFDPFHFVGSCFDLFVAGTALGFHDFRPGVRCVVSRFDLFVAGTVLGSVSRPRKFDSLYAVSIFLFQAHVLDLVRAVRRFDLFCFMLMLMIFVGSAMCALAIFIFVIFCFDLFVSA